MARIATACGEADDRPLHQYPPLAEPHSDIAVRYIRLALPATIPG